MSRIPRRPSSDKPTVTFDLGRSQTQPVFSPGVLLASERATQSCPDVLSCAVSSSVEVKKNNPYYVMDFYPHREWAYKESVTRVAERLLCYSRENLLKKFSAERLSKTDLLNGMIGVREIDWVSERETHFKLILTDSGSLLWKEVEPVEKLLPFEKLLYRSFDFRRATLIMQDYCHRLGENFLLQEKIDQLSEILLHHDIVLQNPREAEFFFHEEGVKKMLSVLQSFELFAVLITKELWLLLFALQNRDSLIPDNLKMLLSLSPNLYPRVMGEIMKVSDETSRVFLSPLIREINTMERGSSPVVLPQSTSSLSLMPAPQSVNSSGSNGVPGRANESSQFLTVKTMTLFPRTPNASPLRPHSKSPKTGCFSPNASPRHS